MTPIDLKGGASTTDPRLDRVPEFDEASRRYPLRAVMRAVPQRSYTWSCVQWLNQGAEGSCAGYAWAHQVAARPRPRATSTTDARAIYHRARQLDSWPGENYSGTSVLAAAKATAERGWIATYRWSFSLNDLIAGVGYLGPAVLGINWYEEMEQPGRDGLARVGGQLMGGHAILCNGVDVTKRLFRLRNSRGLDWGIAGDCYVSFADMDRLLHEQGEACLATKR